MILTSHKNKNYNCRLVRIYLVFYFHFLSERCPLSIRIDNGSSSTNFFRKLDYVDEEVKSLVTAWRIEEPSEINLLLARFHSPGVTKDLTLCLHKTNTKRQYIWFYGDRVEFDSNRILIIKSVEFHSVTIILRLKPRLQAAL